MSSTLVCLADHRARRLVQRLLDVQQSLEDPAAATDSPDADRLFDHLEAVLDDLARTAPLVRGERLRAAIERACAAHDRWWRAATTRSERSAVLAYLRSIEALAIAAEIATRVPAKSS